MNKVNFLLKTTMVSICCLFLFACASTTGVSTKSTPEKAKSTISLNQALLANSEDVTFWLSYGLGISSCAGDYMPYGFEEEYCAFQIASLIALESSEGGESASEFETVIHAAREAGFQRENAFAIFSNTSWYSDHGLNMQGFNKWLKVTYPDFKLSKNNYVNVERAQHKINESAVKGVSIRDDFPVVFGDFIQEAITKYEVKSLGQSIRYRNRKDQSVLSIYAYPIVFPEYQANNLNPIFDGLTETKGTLIYQAQQGEYKDLSLVQERYLSDIDTGFGEYTFKVDNISYRSLSYLTTSGAYFIKVRCSIPANSEADYHELILEMITEMRSHIE